MFSWPDYVIFTLSLAIPVLIGVYFGFFKSQQNTTKEYLYGAGKLTLLPISMSLYSSALASNMMLGMPVEIYVFGGMYSTSVLGYMISVPLTWIFILPIYCGSLKLSSPYEYIELRFSYPVRLLSTVLYVLHTLLFQPTILFTSTLTFSEASGIPLATCIAVVGGFCVFYTTVGGFSSVIWTDTVQGLLTFGAMLFVIFRGANEVGGWAEMWRRADEGQRLEIFNPDLNPFVRISTASSIVGMSIIHFGHAGCTASALQRYIALASEKQARMSTLFSNMGMVVATFLTCLLGWNMYALFYACDPVASNKINNYSKMVPYYIAHIAANVPGVFGLYTAGILCAGLSTVSAEMNTVGGLIYHDIIQRLYKKPISSTHGARIMKIAVGTVGVLYVLIAPIFEKARFIVPLAATIAGITYGAKVGVMILATAFPKCNSKGVICGVLAGLTTTLWIGLGALFYDVSAPYMLPMSTDNCTTTTNSTLLYNTTTYVTDSSTYTTTTAKSPVNSQPFILYQLSFLYYSVFGLLVTLLVAMVVSSLTGFNDVSKMDCRLIAPWMRNRTVSKEGNTIKKNEMRLDNCEHGVIRRPTNVDTDICEYD